MKSSLRHRIIKTLLQVASEQGVALPEPISDDLVLLQSGLDSIGYAILVVELEQQFGFDPFLMSKVPHYPSTLGEFISFYEAQSADSGQAVP